MVTADCQMTSELPLLHVGMVGLQEGDLPPSCQRVLASQHYPIQVTWMPNDLLNISSLDTSDPYDLILLDCRTKRRGRNRMMPKLKNVFGDALIMGLIKEDGSESETGGRNKAAVGWLVKENMAAMAMEWAIQERVFRKRIVTERNQLRRQVSDAFYHKEMAEVASTGLHNVGNVLNSVNVAVNAVHELVVQSSVIVVHQIAELLQGHKENWEYFLTQDSKGRRIPSALVKLGSQLIAEQQAVRKEVEGLIRNVDHVKKIIFSHQVLAKSQSVGESLSVGELLDQAVELSFQPGDAKWVKIQRDYQIVPPAVVDKHQLLQVLVNLLRNAKQAMQLQGGTNHTLSLWVTNMPEECSSVVMTIRDTGIGIAPQNLARMFTRGFTTKQEGNGIGLHSSRLMIQRMGGQLEARSAGVGAGATFTVTLPMQRETMP
jgi:signal transduction histidine kinase